MLWKSLKKPCCTNIDTVKHLTATVVFDTSKPFNWQHSLCLGSSTAWRWKIVCDSIHSGVEHSKLRDSFPFLLKIQFSFSINFFFAEWKLNAATEKKTEIIFIYTKDKYYDLWMWTKHNNIEVRHRTFFLFNEANENSIRIKNLNIPSVCLTWEFHTVISFAWWFPMKTVNR